jgi:hypothetical protein
VLSLHRLAICHFDSGEHYSAGELNHGHADDRNGYRGSTTSRRAWWVATTIALKDSLVMSKFAWRLVPEVGVDHGEKQRLSAVAELLGLARA